MAGETRSELFRMGLANTSGVFETCIVYASFPSLHPARSDILFSSLRKEGQE